MTKTIIGAILVTISFVVGCQTHTQVTELTPVATTTVADTQGVIPRFTNDIWPAINVYNGFPGQNSPGDRQFLNIKAKGMDLNAYQRLDDAVHKLGVVQEGNQTQGDIRREDGLHLSNTDLVAETPTVATLHVCYTYTADTRWSINAPPDLKPFASEATVELRKTDNWYLYAITNDHVVPGCSASSKA